MASRKDFLTQKLITAVENGIHEAIEPLVEAGADVNGIPGFPENSPLCVVANDIENWSIHKLHLGLSDNQKLDYLLTFDTLFACGAHVECLKNVDFDMFGVILSALGLPGVILFAQYDVEFKKLCIFSEKRFSAYRAICYNDGLYESEISFTSKFISKISFGSLKEFLMLTYGYETYEFDGLPFLQFAQKEPKLLAIEFVFGIDFVIQSL